MQEPQKLQVQSLHQEDPLENDNPFQYSCLGNPMDRGTWQAIVHTVMVLEKTLESPLECKEIQPVLSEGKGSVLQEPVCFERNWNPRIRDNLVLKMCLAYRGSVQKHARIH